VKHVLIAGMDSYIGTYVAKALMEEPGVFFVKAVDVRADAWEAEAFSGFDAVFHVAGIAHQREAEVVAEDYYRVNRDLALRMARKAKAEGVSQFIFMSTMSVYGMVCGRITAETREAPNTHYGKSKWMAEQEILKLCDGRFKVSVVRPPMIYGKGCRGNYPRLSRMVQRLPAFPRVGNERSMLYIGCFYAFLRWLILSGDGGLYLPQNAAYVSTDELVRLIALAHGQKIWQPRGLGWLLRLLSSRVQTVGKVFGSLTYDLSMSAGPWNGEQPAFSETVWLTEAGE